MTAIEPLAPRDTLEMYVQDVDGALSPPTIDAKEYQLYFPVETIRSVVSVMLTGRRGYRTPAENESYPPIESGRIRI